MVAFIAAGVAAGLLNVGLVAAIKGTVAVSLLTFLAPAALSIASGFLLKILAPSIDPQGLDLTGASARTIRAPVLPERWIVGRARVAGALVWLHEDDRDLHAIYVLASGACDAVEQIWINGEAGTLTVTGDPHSIGGAAITVDGTRYGGFRDERRFRAQAYLSGSGVHSLPENFAAAAPLPWTSLHRLTGLSFIYVRLHQPDYGTNLDNRIWSGLPELHFLVRGLRFRWPGQDEEAWTENAAAIRYWWLTKRRGIDPDLIDRPLFDAAFATCAETVALDGLDNFSDDYPATIPRYSYNGVITAGDRPEAVEANMDVAWAGYAPEFDGVHRFLPGADRPVSATIGPGDIIAPPGFRPGPEQHERLNRITARIQQSNLHDWTEYAVEALDDTDAQTRDGTVLQSDLGILSFVADPVAGLNLLAIQLRRERAVAQVDLTLRPGDDFGNMTIAPGDTVSLTLPEWGLDAARYFVLSSEVGEDWGVRLGLVEQPDGLYADTLILPPLDGGTFFPTPSPVDPEGPGPTGLTLSYRAVLGEAYAPPSGQPRLGLFSWAAVADASGYQFQIRPAAETVPDASAWCPTPAREFARSLWQTDAGGDFDAAGQYRWWVRSVAADGTPSNHTAGGMFSVTPSLGVMRDSPVPANPGSPFAVFQNGIAAFFFADSAKPITSSDSPGIRHSQSLQEVATGGGTRGILSAPFGLYSDGSGFGFGLSLSATEGSGIWYFQGDASGGRKSQIFAFTL